MGIANVQLPPGKELDEFTIEIKFSSINTSVGDWNFILYGASILSNSIGNDYGSAKTYIGLLQGRLYLNNNFTDSACDAKILDYFISDGKIHKLVIALKNNITKVYIDNILVLDQQYFYKFYNFDFY